MSEYAIAILVKNQFGVLNKVTKVFFDKQVNIDSITACETESENHSRITAYFDCDDETRQQLVGQLYELPEVYGVKALNSDDFVNCELMLIKVKNSPESREDIRIAADAFKAETVDYSCDSVVMRITGETRRIEAFIALMQEFTILELCRTGIVAMTRGHKSTLTE